jgi:hypothetical protein
MDSVERTRWKPILITLLCSGALAITCCSDGPLIRGPQEVPLLILGAISAGVFVLQLLVAFVRLLIDAFRK